MESTTPSTYRSRDRPYILYEGNYNEWRQDIGLHFAAEGLSHIINSTLPTGEQSAYHFKVKSWQVARDVRPRVSPALLDRVPGDVRNSAYQLLEFLRKIARPLRLLSLPRDIRRCVYDQIEELQENGGLRQPPAIIQVCQQLRSETRPLYFENTPFYFHVLTRIPFLYRYIGILDVWSEIVARDNFENLGRIRLDLGGDHIEISFTASKVQVRRDIPPAVVSNQTPSPIWAVVLQGREERLERLQSVAGWITAVGVKNPGWKKRAIFEILQAVRRVERMS